MWWWPGLPTSWASHDHAGAAAGSCTTPRLLLTPDLEQVLLTLLAVAGKPIHLLGEGQTPVLTDVGINCSRMVSVEMWSMRSCSSRRYRESLRQPDGDPEFARITTTPMLAEKRKGKGHCLPFLLRQCPGSPLGYQRRARAAARSAIRSRRFSLP